MRNSKRLLLITMFVLLSLAVTGCRGSGTVATGWPGITVDGDTAYIAYNQSIYMIDLADDGDQLDTLPGRNSGRRRNLFPQPLTARRRKTGRR